MPALNDLLSIQLASANATLKDHQERFAKDPVEALHWVGDVVGAAAHARVFTAVLRLTDKGMTTDKILHLAQGNVFRLASYGAIRSTGVLDGALAAEELGAWAKIAELVQGVIDFEADTKK